MSDSPALARKPAVAALSAAAACALVAAAVSTTSILSRERPERCCDTAAGTSRVTPASTTAASTTRPAGPPLCLIGSWRTVDETFMIEFYDDRPKIRFTGNSRHFEFRPDGTALETQDNVVLTAQYDGRELRLVGNGTATYTWTAADHKITYAARTKTDFTWSYYDQRGLINTERSGDEPALNEVDDYTCSGSSMLESSANGYRSTWTRTSEYGVYG